MKLKYNKKGGGKINETTKKNNKQNKKNSNPSMEKNTTFNWSSAPKPEKNPIMKLTEITYKLSKKESQQELENCMLKEKRSNAHYRVNKEAVPINLEFNNEGKSKGYSINAYNSDWLGNRYENEKLSKIWSSIYDKKILTKEKIEELESGRFLGSSVYLVDNKIHNFYLFSQLQRKGLKKAQIEKIRQQFISMLQITDSKMQTIQ